MTYAEASLVVLPFGKFRGQTIDHVAESDAGLLYLDWLIGQNWIRDGLRTALETYLGDPGIKGEIEKVMKVRR